MKSLKTSQLIWIEGMSRQSSISQDISSLVPQGRGPKSPQSANIVHKIEEKEVEDSLTLTMQMKAKS